MEATDDVIGRLVGEQVDRIGSLLVRALGGEGGGGNVKANGGAGKNGGRNCGVANGKKILRKGRMIKKENDGEEGGGGGGGRDATDLGTPSSPLILGTACSGTDAPSLAMTLVSEHLSRRNLPSLFHHSHAFSCEVDPFKQAYLARNFDSELYPDISHLTDRPSPRDVYGREQPVPEFNLFVAGTSCKNFSMLRSNRRIDIEDRGCSGETFLAAVDLLMDRTPPYAVFENVIGAPWEKMAEYITGRLRLSSCDDKKAVKENKDKNAELTFSQSGEKKILVEKVPAVYGVRCGAVVQGYLAAGSGEVRPVEWPSSVKTSTTCTLTQLIKYNGISRKDDTLVLETPVTYCAHYAKVDTKDYGLPQTRQRTYMFVWRAEDGRVDDDLGVYWEAILRHLKSPVRHSLESFILQVDHDIVRTFREALNGPAGRQTKRGTFLEPDFW